MRDWRNEAEKVPLADNFSPYLIYIFIFIARNLDGILDPTWMTVPRFGSAQLTPGSNDRTNSQVGADRRQLPAATQIGDGILRHALQNSCTSFCGYKCCPGDCGWQALPSRVCPFSFGIPFVRSSGFPLALTTDHLLSKNFNPRPIPSPHPFATSDYLPLPFIFYFYRFGGGTRLTFTHFRIMTITDQGDSDLLNIAETTA